ncbi:hypothetical protein PIB30_034958 [Stylosanthes scabra]|uniref:Uncharacterized protein n=1 Tax=Stylosanthes scabra TaxID=79078 RepID=A0ABU6YBX2_9FABA|nr:hypothetical protein [Stylosanthes scabra]
MKRSSLPTETKEEGRKRKQFRTLRWMEAKRRRSDKQLAMMENESGDGSADSGIGMQCKYNNNEIGKREAAKLLLLEHCICNCQIGH